MVKKYANPPVAEAVCEFRFSQESPWDMTFPGILFENMKDEYPKRDQRWVREVVVLLGPEGLREELLVTERAQFSTEDDGCAIQVGPHLMSVNCRKEYADWDSFRSRIEDAYTRFRDVIGVEAIRTMNLRYINLIEIPEEVVTLSDYFAFYPLIPVGLQRTPAGFITGCEFTFHDNRDNCRVELTDAVPESPGANAYLLNLDYFLAREAAISPDDVMDWLSTAHTEVERIFEACIKDPLRELFGKVQEKALPAT